MVLSVRQQGGRENHVLKRFVICESQGDVAVITKRYLLEIQVYNPLADEFSRSRPEQPAAQPRLLCSGIGSPSQGKEAGS